MIIYVQGNNLTTSQNKFIQLVAILLRKILFLSLFYRKWHWDSERWHYTLMFIQLVNDKVEDSNSHVWFTICVLNNYFLFIFYRVYTTCSAPQLPSARDWIQGLGHSRHVLLSHIPSHLTTMFSIKEIIVVHPEKGVDFVSYSLLGPIFLLVFHA